MNEKTASDLAEKILEWLRENTWELEFNDEDGAHLEIKNILMGRLEMPTKEWIQTFTPEIQEDTGHYVTLKIPQRALPVRDLPQFCEKLLSLGYRYLAADANGIVCEKIQPIAHS